MAFVGEKNQAYSSLPCTESIAQQIPTATEGELLACSTRSASAAWAWMSVDGSEIKSQNEMKPWQGDPHNFQNFSSFRENKTTCVSDCGLNSLGYSWKNEIVESRIYQTQLGNQRLNGLVVGLESHQEGQHMSSWLG